MVSLFNHPNFIEKLNSYFTTLSAAAASCSGRGRYQCENGRCVSMDVVCNGVDNCGDASDENNHTLCHSMAPLSHCEFVCDNKKCVRDALVCNYVDDCGDSSDESGCRKWIKLCKLRLVNKTEIKLRQKMSILCC